MEYRESNGIGHSKRVAVTKMTRTGARSRRLAQNILVLASFFRYAVSLDADQKKIRRYCMRRIFATSRMAI